MKTKQILMIISTAALLTFSAVPVLAQTPSGTPGAKTAAALTTRMQNLLNRGINEIDRRVKVLTAFITRINKVKRLTDSQKSSLVGQVQAQIDSLNALKTKIQGDTDITTLRSDVKSIIDSYRIFALFVPKMHIIMNADRMLSVIADMQTISGKLQTRINKAKTAGKDVTQAQSLLDDRNAKLTDATTQANNAINAVLPLQPSGWPDNKSVLMSARDMLRTARTTDLVQAVRDANQIREILKGFSLGKAPTPTP